MERGVRTPWATWPRELMTRPRRLRPIPRQTVQLSTVLAQPTANSFSNRVEHGAYVGSQTVRFRGTGQCRP